MTSKTLDDSYESSQSVHQKTPIHYKILVIVSMISLIAGSLTGIMTYVNKGYSLTFFSDWLSSFLLAVLIMAPTGFIMIAIISKGVGKLFGHLSTIKQQLITGGLMAVVMESVMATTTAANLVGFEDLTTFSNSWLHSFIYALPFGLVIALVMNLFIKPKLDAFMKS